VAQRPAVQPLGGCVVSTFARKLTTMRVELLKKRRLAKSAACAGCDPFARNRPSGRGMGGKGRLTFVTVYSRRCDVSTEVYTETRKHQPRPPSVPGCERHPTACDWSSNVGSEDEKAVNREPDAATPLSKRLRSTQVKV